MRNISTIYQILHVTYILYVNINRVKSAKGSGKGFSNEMGLLCQSRFTYGEMFGGRLFTITRKPTQMRQVNKILNITK